MEPISLGPNQPRRFYRGGARISSFRGTRPVDDHRPEDWIASVTPLFGDSEAGLSKTANGEVLRDLLHADPIGFLGPEHVARFGGPDPGVLVKLLDAGQRLPVHAHPDREFSRRHLDCTYGKTEAWLILDAEPGALVHLGFRRAVAAGELQSWVDEQDVEAMLDAMHAASVEAGDAVLVPAGLPHAVGEGVFLLELQEPTDWSVLLEYAGFDLDGPRDGHLGLGFGRALGCVDRRIYSSRDIAALRRRVNTTSARSSVFPRSADSFFRAERLTPEPTVNLEADYAVLITIRGEGRLATPDGCWSAQLQHGTTMLIPHAAGPVELVGEVEAIRCRGPRHPPPALR